MAAESDAAFVMTGDGPMHERVHALIKRDGLGPRVQTLGFVPDAASIIAEVDIVVVPSRLDGMPLVILEAMALGKPIVASAVGSIPEVIDDGRTGYMCQPGDIEAFATPSRRVGRRSGAPRARSGAAAAADYAEHYSWERAYHQYHEAFARASALAAGRTAAS